MNSTFVISHIDEDENHSSVQEMAMDTNRRHTIQSRSRRSEGEGDDMTSDAHALNSGPSSTTGNSDENGDDPKPDNFPQALKNSEYRRKFFHTAWLCGIQFVLGVRRCQIGVTFLDLQIITQTDVEQASVFFTAGSLGETVGSLLPGLLGKVCKVNTNSLLLVSILGMGVSVVAIPYCSSVHLMLGVQFTASFFMGVLQTSCSSEVLRVWAGNGHTAMQMTYCIFSLGGIITPVFTDPFLSKMSENRSSGFGRDGKLSASNASKLTFRSSRVSNMPRGNKSFYQFLESLSSNNTDADREAFAVISNFGNVSITGAEHYTAGNVTQSTTDVHYAFLINGVVCGIVAIPFLAMVVLTFSGRISDETETNKEGEVRKRRLPKHIKLLIFASLFIFFLLFICCDDMFASYLMTFLVREFDLSKHKAAQLVTGAWLAYGFTNCAMVLISKIISPVKILLASFFLLVLIFPAFVIAAWCESVTLFTVVIIAYGISAAPIFPTTLVWADAELIPVPGTVMAAIFTGTGLGPLITPLFIGHLIQHVDNVWFCYMLFIYGSAYVSVYLFMVLFNSLHLNFRYGALASRQVHHTRNSSITDRGIEDSREHVALREKECKEGCIHS